MTALGKLLRTTAFRLTLVYLVVFALFAAFLLGYFALNTRRLINEQIAGIVDTEVQPLTGAIQSGRHQAARRHRRRALAPSRIKPLSRHHADRRGACRQCRLA